jgi:hypothetical protein
MPKSDRPRKKPSPAPALEREHKKGEHAPLGPNGTPELDDFPRAAPEPSPLPEPPPQHIPTPHVKLRSCFGPQ